MTIKFSANPIPLAYPTDSQRGMEYPPRLIVLVPANIECGAATQQIWGLAHAACMHIQLLGLCNDATEESRLRRGLITMASLLQNSKLSAEMKVATGTDWLNTLKTNYEAGDMIVCFAEQETGFLRKPLSQILESNLKATVYILSNPAPQKFNSNRLAQLRIWVGIIVIIAGFTLLQAKIVQLPPVWLQNLLLILSIISEFWLIWVWGEGPG